MQADTTEGFGVILWFLDVIEKAEKIILPVLRNFPAVIQKKRPVLKQKNGSMKPFAYISVE